MELRCSRLLTGQLTKWILRSYFRSFSGKEQSQDLYKCLGVAPSASAKEIKAAFYKKSKELHPDRNSSPTANEDFARVAEAYTVLSDCEKRKDFDKKRNAPGYRRTGHDEAFKRRKQDFESRSGAPNTSHQWEEWYQRNYKNPESHPFWEKEDARREQFNREKTEQSQDQETRNSKSYSFHNNPNKRDDPRRHSFYTWISELGFYTWIFLLFFTQPQKPGPRYFNGEPVKRDKGDEFIRRYNAELAAKEAQNQPKGDAADDHKRKR